MESAPFCSSHCTDAFASGIFLGKCQVAGTLFPSHPSLPPSLSLSRSLSQGTLNWPGNRLGRRTVDELGRTRSMIARQHDDEQQQRRRPQAERWGEGNNDGRPPAPGVTQPSSPDLQPLASPSTPTSPKLLRVREQETESLTRPSSPSAGSE